jgi:hypothetical protein
MNIHNKSDISSAALTYLSDISKTIDSTHLGCYAIGNQSSEPPAGIANDAT